MTDGRLALRGTAALAVGAFALHQLRYALGYGDAAMQTLAAHGHGYLALLTPVVALMVAIAAGQFLAQLAAARRSGEAGRRIGGLWAVWAGAAAVLFATYAGQELLEGAASAAHPGGVDAVFGGGGWWALPLSVVVGLLVALVMRGADACVARATAQCDPRARPPVPPARRWVTADLRAPRVLARNLAGRAPPPLSV